MRKRPIWAAWGLLALGCLGNAAAIALSVAEGSLLGEHPGEALLWMAFTALLVVGCLILARRPGNVIGWIFVAVGLLTMAAALAENYAQYAYAHPGSLPGPLVAAWVFNWIWGPLVVLVLVFPLLLFPTGRSLSPRWRPVTWLAVGFTAALTVLGMLRPSLYLTDEQTIPNPIGVAGADIEAAPLSMILNGLLVFLLAGAVVSLVVRFRRSRGVERQQLKWFTYAGALVLLIPLIGFVVPSLGNAAFVLVLALPIAVGIAILRYRLYDIDRLINRTLVYGLLTALLVSVYSGAVLVPPSWSLASYSAG